MNEEDRVIPAKKRKEGEEGPTDSEGKTINDIPLEVLKMILSNLKRKRSGVEKPQLEDRTGRE